MKLPVITDSHAGARNDSSVFLDNAKKFYDNVFFPKLKEIGASKVLHLGDILDRRKFINFVTANRLRKDFMNPLAEANISLDHVLGNHDVYYKDTNAVSGVIELYGHSTYPIDIITETEHRTYDGLDVLLVPWICDENKDRSIRAIEASNARACMGHLELVGFEMMRGNVMKHGMETTLFEKFETVASGHYHHPSMKGAVKYLGASQEFDWSDYDDPRGFHLFDTETLQWEFVKNPYSVFHRVVYNDVTMSKEELLGQIDPEKHASVYLKVTVEEKTDPHLFDKFIEAIEEVGPADLQVIDQQIQVAIETADDIIAQAEDALTLMSRFAQTLDSKNLNPDVLNDKLRALFVEAQMRT